MLAVKLHLACTVLATLLAAVLVDRRVPYFPIEVSRAAASGPVASWALRWGARTLGVTLLATDSFTATTTALWISLSAIALFDDVRFWAAHMGGVVGLFAVAILAATSRGRGAALPLLAGVLLYALRLVFKVAAIVFYEMPAAPPLQTLARLLVDGETREIVFRRSMAVMFHGAKACADPAHTLPMFQLGGVLQWVVFYVLAFVF